MNKEKFLQELEKKLKVLSQEERQDILNEYEDIIAEKMKHGKTEEEAVKEFGDIKSLSEEILKSYKINPNYQKNGSDLLGECEDFIKKGAQKLSEVTEEVVDSFKSKEQEMNLESVFEIVIKVILILIVLSLLRIPFWVVGQIGESLFGNLFLGGHFLFSNHNWFGILIRIITELAYIGICILLIVTVIKKGNISKNSQTIKKEAMDENTKQNPSNVKKKIERNTNQGTTNVVSQVVLLLLKLFLFLLFVFPLLLLAMGILVVLCILLFLLIKGVAIYAPFILVFGVFTFITHFITILVRVLFANKKVHVWPFGLSLLMTILGGIFTIDYLWSFTYDGESNPTGYSLKQEEYIYRIQDGMHIDYDKIEIDNTLEDNEVKIEVEYYHELVRLNKQEYTYKEDDVYHPQEEKKTYDMQYVDFYTEEIGRYKINRLLNKTIIEDLKRQEIHDYRRLFHPYVKVFVNEKTKQKID